MQENVFAYYMETVNTENTPTKAMNKNSSNHSLRPCNPAIILCGSNSWRRVKTPLAFKTASIQCKSTATLNQKKLKLHSPTFYIRTSKLGRGWMLSIFWRFEPQIVPELFLSCVDMIILILQSLPISLFSEDTNWYSTPYAYTQRL